MCPISGKRTFLRHAGAIWLPGRQGSSRRSLRLHDSAKRRNTKNNSILLAIRYYAGPFDYICKSRRPVTRTLSQTSSPMWSNSPRCRRGAFISIYTALILALTGCAKEDPKNIAERKVPPATQVMVAKAEKQQVPVEIRAIGNIEAFSAVDVKSQVRRSYRPSCVRRRRRCPRKDRSYSSLILVRSNRLCGKPKRRWRIVRRRSHWRRPILTRYRPSQERQFASESLCRAYHEGHHRSRTERAVPDNCTRS